MSSSTWRGKGPASWWGSAGSASGGQWRGGGVARGDRSSPSADEQKWAEADNSWASGSQRASRWRGCGAREGGFAPQPVRASEGSNDGVPDDELDHAGRSAFDAVVLCHDPPSGFTPTYDAQPPASGFASVNAGNGKSLRVGGSGLNGQFAQDLERSGLNIGAFQRVHRDLMSLACREPGTLVEAPNASSNAAGLQCAFGRVSDSHGEGFVAIDVFHRERRPFHADNVAMVYCVGPDRRDLSSDDAFLSAIRLVGEDITRACMAYGEAAASKGLPAISRVRLALVSGGKYSGKVPPLDVARSLLRGLLRGLTANGSADGLVGRIQTQGPDGGDGRAGAKDDEVAGPPLADSARPLVFELAYAGGRFREAVSALKAELATSPEGRQHPS